jgi:hypothetical protein
MLKIVRPAIALSPEMTSHKVSVDHFRKVQCIYENVCTRRSQQIITDYFDDDVIKSVIDDYKGRTIRVSIVRTIDREALVDRKLEIVNQHHIPLGLNRFKSKLEYQHERQRVELRYYGPDWTMVMQILLVGLSDPKSLNITQIVKNIENEDVVSLSYYLEVVTSDLDVHLNRMSRSKNKILVLVVVLGLMA